MAEFTIQKGGTETVGPLSGDHMLVVNSGVVEVSTEAGVWVPWAAPEGDKFNDGLTLNLRNNRNRPAVVRIQPA